MDWEKSEVAEISEAALQQEEYGSRKTLFFGLTMTSLFIVTYMTINNFAFRAFCVRYLMSPFPFLISSFGYIFCILFLILAFYAFIVYFKIAKPIGKGFDLKSLKSLGLPYSSSQADSKSVTSRTSKYSLPRPLWSLVENYISDENNPNGRISKSEAKESSSAHFSSTKMSKTSPSKGSPMTSPTLKRKSTGISSDKSPRSPKSPKPNVDWLFNPSPPRTRTYGSTPGGSGSGNVGGGALSSSSGGGGSGSSGFDSPVISTGAYGPGPYSSKKPYPVAPSTPSNAMFSSPGSSSLYDLSTASGLTSSPSHPIYDTPMSPSPPMNSPALIYPVSSPMYQRRQQEMTPLYGSRLPLNIGFQQQQSSKIGSHSDLHSSFRSLTASPPPSHSIYQTPTLSNQNTTRMSSSMSSSNPNIPHGGSSTSNRYYNSPSAGLSSSFNSLTSTPPATPEIPSAQQSSYSRYASPSSSSHFSMDSHAIGMSPPSVIYSSTTNGQAASPSPSTSMAGPTASSSSYWSPQTDFFFSDDSQMQQYVEGQNRQRMTRAYLSPTHSSGHPSTPGSSSYDDQSSSSSTSKAQIKMPAYMSVAPPISSDKPSSKSDGAYSDDAAAMALYQKLNITNSLQMWGENLREWISKRVLKPLVEWMDKVEKDLGRDALIHPQFSQVHSQVQNLQQRQNMMFSISNTRRPGLSGAATATGEQQRQDSILATCMELERYFGDFGTSREYVVERIRELEKGSVMQCYNWCGGGKWKGKDWTTDLPTDAHIVCHFFCCQLDKWIKANDGSHVHDAFRSKYYVGKDEKGKKAIFAIVQTNVNPPHYVLYDDHKEMPILRGRNNLFDVICVFLLTLKNHYKGCLNQRHFGGKIGLLQLIED